MLIDLILAYLTIVVCCILIGMLLEYIFGVAECVVNFFLRIFGYTPREED